MKLYPTFVHWNSTNKQSNPLTKKHLRNFLHHAQNPTCHFGLVYLHVFSKTIVRNFGRSPKLRNFSFTLRSINIYIKGSDFFYSFLPCLFYKIHWWWKCLDNSQNSENNEQFLKLKKKTALTNEQKPYHTGWGQLHELHNAHLT